MAALRKYVCTLVNDVNDEPLILVVVVEAAVARPAPHAHLVL